MSMASPGIASRHPPRLDFVLSKSDEVGDQPLVLSRGAGAFKILEITTSDPRAEVKILEQDPSGLLAPFWSHTGPKRSGGRSTALSRSARTIRATYAQDPHAGVAN